MILTIDQARKKYKGATIHEGVVIHDSVEIGKGALVCEGSAIYEGVTIHEGVVIPEGARICEGASVKSAIVITSIGEAKNITGIECENGELLIGIGCMNDYEGLPLDETRKEVLKKYPPEHIYFDALNLIEKWFKTRGLE